MPEEFSRIEMVRRVLQGSAAGADQVVLGIGDDAAVLRGRGAQNWVCSVDAAVEGVHFRRTFLSWRRLGARSYLVALSDLSAMGAQPSAALVSMVLPPDLDDHALGELARGYADVAERLRVPVVGGNLAAGTELQISTTVMGTADGTGTRRSGAQVGDLLYVSGEVGAAALGLRALLLPLRDPDAMPFIERWRRPPPRVEHGLELRALATACIDISDGLVQDLGHLCDASGVGAELLTAQLPTRPGHFPLAERLACSGLNAALAGGEDYELLFTAPAERQAPPWATPIGRVTAAAGRIDCIGADGSLLQAPPQGYGHFR